MKAFWEELTDLITRHKDLGYSIDEMVADMQGEIDGLCNELEDEKNGD